ncbi:Metallophosphoesterase mpped2 [Mactra antiquata]
MASLLNYIDNFFGRKVNLEYENSFATNKTGRGNLRSDANASDPNKAWAKRRKHLKRSYVDPMDLETPVKDDHVRFVCISDTHTKLEQSRTLKIPDGDVLLHAGDFTMYGYEEEVQIVNDYLNTLSHKHKVIIAGNHDRTFDPDFKEKRHSRKIPFLSDIPSKPHEKRRYNMHELLTNCIYLKDSSVEIYGLKIFGSPWTPGSGFWGFQKPRGPQLMEKWNNIPSDTDILMTHCPPCGYGDDAMNYGDALLSLLGAGHHANHAGCVDLLNTINSRVKPLYHIFGHIHEGYGTYTDGTTTFINASICTKLYQPTNLPIVFDVPLPRGHTKNEDIKVENIDHVTEEIDDSDNDDIDFIHDNNDDDGLGLSVSKKDNDLCDFLSYRPDGKTNFEKLTMIDDTDSKMIFNDDDDDGDDVFFNDDDKGDVQDTDVDNGCLDSNNDFVVFDSEYVIPDNDENNDIGCDVDENSDENDDDNNNDVVVFNDGKVVLNNDENTDDRADVVDDDDNGNADVISNTNNVPNTENENNDNLK